MRKLEAVVREEHQDLKPDNMLSLWCMPLLEEAPGIVMTPAALSIVNQTFRFPQCEGAKLLFTTSAFFLKGCRLHYDMVAK
jgi:hypothetical protein